ncbi:arsenate reductase ArsC [Methylotenera sp. G11]|uniref:arsenate reductase ArsC n=1 Tax=Methylotenera sp. G11 TaxID=1506585 RepID=UPI000646AE42
MIGRTIVGKSYNVLILGTANSATSIMAEALFNIMGHGVFHAYSAGSTPAGVVSRFAVEEIRNTGYPTEKFRSKSWHEFTHPDAPVMDFVITVCDHAAKESPLVWRGKPLMAHWSFDDPTAVKGTFEEKRAAFKKTFLQIRDRIDLFAQLPLAHLDQMTLNRSMARLEKEFADMASGEPVAVAG